MTHAHPPKPNTIPPAVPPASPASSAPAPPATEVPPCSALRFDWQDWLPYLEEQDIPLEQKQDLIKTLWTIVLTFMDMGYAVKPTAETCGNAIDLKTALETAVLHLDTPQNTTTHATPHIGKEARHV